MPRQCIEPAPEAPGSGPQGPGRVRAGAYACMVCPAHLEGVEVVRANCHERALPAQVLVELVLEVDEAVVRGLVKGDPPEDGRDDERPDQRRLRLDGEALGARGDDVRGRGRAAEEDGEGARDALEAEHVVPVRGDVDLVDDLLVGADLTDGCAALLALHLGLARLDARTTLGGR